MSRWVFMKDPNRASARARRAARPAAALLLLALTACGGGSDATSGDGGQQSASSESVDSESGPGTSTGSTGSTDSTGSTGSTGSDTGSESKNPPLLSIQGVTLGRVAPGATTCQLGVTILNEGAGDAEAVMVQARVETVSEPSNSAEPLLEGPDQIVAGDEKRYFSNISFVFEQGDLMRYDVEVRIRGTVVDTMSSDVGIQCTE
jgi:hypothetical protein